MTTPDEPAGDIEPTIKNWAIALFGPSVHIGYTVPEKWAWDKPVVTVRTIIESYPGIDPNGLILTQFDCWAGPRDKITAAGLKATLLGALDLLSKGIGQWIDDATGNILAAAYGTTVQWLPDDTTTTGSTKAGPLPRYSVTTTLVAGKAPVTA